jgi:hypothetical protein
MNWILLLIFVFGIYNMYLHYMVLSEGRIALTHGFELEQIRQNRFFFIYDLLFAFGASLYLSTFLKGWSRILLLTYAVLHAIGHGYYIFIWESGDDAIETVLKWSTVHPSQREFAMSPWWNQFNWWGTLADLGLHTTVTVLAAGFLIASVKK